MEIMILVGIGLIGLGIYFFFARKRSKETVFNIKATQTFKAKDLIDLHNSVKEDIGIGSFNKILEVKGVVKCDNPLVAELSNQKCVYYSMKIIHEYEETYSTKNAQGRYETRTRKGSEVLSSNAQSTQFYVQDDTGKVLVNPTDATLHTIKVMDRFEREVPNRSTITFGKFSINLPTNSSGRRTLGYRYVEEIIPIDRPIYVLGEASDLSGELAIQLPKDKKESFIVSLKSEEELVRHIEKSITWYLVGAIISIIIGILLIVSAPSATSIFEQ